MQLLTTLLISTTLILNVSADDSIDISTKTYRQTSKFDQHQAEGFEIGSKKEVILVKETNGTITIKGKGGDTTRYEGSPKNVIISFSYDQPGDDRICRLQEKAQGCDG